MAGSAINPNVVRFGLFEADLRAGELRKSGMKIKLQDQPFQILAMLLERPGEIVTREELQKRLWPEDTFVDFDLSLNSAVKKLRQALSDDSDNPRFIETLYRRGYRFIGHTNGGATTTSMEPLPNRSVSSTDAVVAPLPSSSSISRILSHPALLWTIPAVLILIAALIWLSRPSPAPRILGYTQITHDGLRKGTILTDGERLYFQEMKAERFGIAQVSVSGGEAAMLETPFGNVYASDIAADGSALLIASFKDTEGPPPLWSLPLPTGPPERLSDAFGLSAVWSRDRSRIVFSNAPGIFVAKANGSEPRKLATVTGTVDGVRFSPDGRKLRIDVLDPKNGSSTIWEANSDGSQMRPLLPGWNDAPHECCGNWTPDGKYYVFQSLRDGKSNLWILSEQRSWFGSRPKPVQLTNGPLDFAAPVASRDGKRIFAVGAQPRGELMRYDSKLGFVPYLGGMSATDVAFSPEGQSAAYVSIPERALWRCQLDGSRRLRLTEPSMQAALPRWSPNGKLIVFMGRTTSTNWRTYVIASDGGAIRDVVPGADAGFDPSWSADGKSLALTLNEAGSSFVATGPGIAVLDLQTQKFSPLPNAAQLFSPRWSPDGKYIAAITDDSQKLLIFDRAAQRWLELVSMPIGYPTWSHDGQYIYFDTTLTDDPAFFRVRISDRKLERLVGLKGLNRFWGQFASWTGLAPDDSPLMLRDTSSQEIYALDLQLP